ncbi:MAG: class I adenylate-forming enzyme family protein [bacterium]
MADSARDTFPCPVAVNAGRDPEGIALRGNDAALTHAELHRMVHRWEQRFTAEGLAVGDRVALLAGNSLAHATLVYAALRYGVVLAPLNPRLDATAWQDHLRRLNCRFLLVDREYRPFARQSGLRHGLLELPEQTDRALDSNEPPPRIPCPRPASIIFTSGSSGRAKGVVLSAGNHLASARSANAHLPLKPDHCWLAALPFNHVGGLAILFRTALAGCCCRVVTSFAPEVTWELIRRGEVSHLSLVPTMLRHLLSCRPDALPDARLTAILLGGGPAGTALLHDPRVRDLPLLTTYGLTETASQVSTLPLEAPAAERVSAGRPLPGVAMEIVDDANQTVATNVTGRIRVRCEAVCLGYLDHEDQPVRDAGGWFTTSDFGFFDDPGYLHVVGRQDEVFISGGENVHPAPIETAAAAYPGVSECAVIAVPDEEWGKRPLLLVSADPDAALDLDGLENHLAEQLPSLLRPETIVLVKDFPRSTIGKIDKPRLRREFLRSNQ